MMRNTYIEDDTISLVEYVAQLDDMDRYRCWQDEGTQRGYNYRMAESFEEFAQGGGKSRFIATIKRKSDGVCVGSIFVSPEDTLPDLAIMIYPQHRGKGYGTSAFSLGANYCFDELGLERIYAGCYPDNAASLAMLSRCGFVPHPEGNSSEKHFLTGEDIVQWDFVSCNPRRPCGRHRD